MNDYPEAGLWATVAVAVVWLLGAAALLILGHAGWSLACSLVSIICALAATYTSRRYWH